MTKESLERLLVDYGVSFTSALADRLLQEFNSEICEDTISRRAVIDAFWKLDIELRPSAIDSITGMFETLPSVIPSRPTERCKDCKYFKYDSPAMVDGIPLIVAHEICSKWGGGCKTCEDGYCFMFEPQESEETETWNDFHGQTIVPKGTFMKIYNDQEESEDDI